MRKIMAVMLLGVAFLNASPIEDRIVSLENELKSLKKNIIKNNKNIVKNKILANNDNLKWNVNFRTAFDYIKDGDNIFTNKLDLSGKYKVNDNLSYYQTLSVNKIWGSGINTPQSDLTPNIAQYDTTLRAKEMFWLYMGDDEAYTVSIGRRPATDGLLGNYRVNKDQPKSAPAHLVNVEMDGLSIRVNGEEKWFKICAGKASNDWNLAGVIVAPIDDGENIVIGTYVEDNKDFEAVSISYQRSGISEYEDLNLFISYSATDSSNNNMKAFVKGNSILVGANSYINENGILGIEMTSTSDNYTPFTGEEDTLPFSKMAMLGKTYEAFYNHKLQKGLSVGIRALKGDLDNGNEIVNVRTFVEYSF